jgi:breast cancer 2 susceptibility protein
MRRMSFTAVKATHNHDKLKHDVVVKRQDKMHPNKEEEPKDKDVFTDKDALDKVKNTVFTEIEQDKVTAVFAETENATLGGFSTAKGSKIDISKEAFDKVKALFTETEQGPTENALQLDDDNAKSVSRKCLSKSPIHESSKKRKSLVDPYVQDGDHELKQKPYIRETNVHFSDELDLDTQMLRDVERQAYQSPTTHNVILGGFSTANGSKIDISKEALEKVKNTVFTEIDQEPENAILGGFSTAKGSKIDISKEALDEVKAVFTETDQWPTENATLGGFSTAKGSKIEISKEALEKVKNTVFTEIDQEPENAILGGFSTAKGSKIDISKEALDKVRNVFTEIDQESESERAILGGFSTAKGSKIDISKEALEKVKAVFTETEQERTENPTFGGFSTAKGSKIDISKEALDKVRNVFTEIDQESEPERAILGGFSTAKGSKIEISKEALDKVKNTVFTEIDDQEPECASLGGFSTAKGSKIDISKEALDKVRNVFTETEQEPTENATLGGGGFSTAKGSKIKISKEALDKVKSSVFIETEPGPADNAVQQEAIDDDDNKSVRSLRSKSPILESSKKRKSLADPCILDGVHELKKPCIRPNHVDFSDELDLDTQMLRDVERQVFHSPTTPSRRKSSTLGGGCKLIGIPKVSDGLVKARTEERQKQRHLIVEAAKKKVPGAGGAKRPQQGALLKSKSQTAKVKVKLTDLWADLNDEEDVAKNHNVHWSTLNMTSEMAGDHVFVGRQYFSEAVLTSDVSIALGDGAQVILNEACNVDLDNLTLSFLTSPGVDPSKVSEGWVRNHYRWIVWKLASLERRFPAQYGGGRSLHPHQVLLQLRLRYDLEIQGSVHFSKKLSNLLKKQFKKNSRNAKL